MDEPELFKAREFDNAADQKRFAKNRIENVAEYLDGQGIPPLFIAHALFDLHKRYNEIGLKALTEENH